MHNAKVLKQRAKLYDDLLTCVYCQNKFTSGTDLDTHIRTEHKKTQTAGEWWGQYQQILFRNKDSLWITDAKSDLHSFTYSELSDAAREMKKRSVVLDEK